MLNNNDRTVTVTHSEVSQGLAEITTTTYTVTNASDGEDLEAIKLLADIEVDNYGHITKKKFITLSWKI